MRRLTYVLVGGLAAMAIACGGGVQPARKAAVNVAAEVPAAPAVTPKKEVPKQTKREMLASLIDKDRSPSKTIEEAMTPSIRGKELADIRNDFVLEFAIVGPDLKAFNNKNIRAGTLHDSTMAYWDSDAEFRKNLAAILYASAFSDGSGMVHIYDQREILLATYQWKNGPALTEY